MSIAIVVDAEWDAEAMVWTAASPDVGLFTEAKTLDELQKRISVIAGDLLAEENGAAPELAVELVVRFRAPEPQAA
jgi:hypothetical protein